MHKIVTLWIELIEGFAAALSKDEMTRPAITRLDRLLSIGRHVFAIMAPEAPIPIFVADEIRMGPPIGFHLWKEIVAIDGLRRLDDAAPLAPNRGKFHAAKSRFPASAASLVGKA